MLIRTFEVDSSQGYRVMVRVRVIELGPGLGVTFENDITITPTTYLYPRRPGLGVTFEVELQRGDLSLA